MSQHMLRAATYARYSTDLQSVASIDDQERICTQLITDRGWVMVHAYSDAAISGASLERPGYQRLLEDAQLGHFDVIVTEDLDRVGRDQEHIAAFYKQMSFLNIPIVTVADGEISEMHIGLKGTMAALYLKDLAAKTHRGLEGRVRKGRSAGGISYGYRVKRAFNADGTPVTGEREIVPDEAAIVQRIFRAYDAGQSARTIAAALNEEGVPAPGRGEHGAGTWGPSTISGNWKRGTGILNNDIYAGRLVWNRQRYVKDPITGKRQARLNPESDWIIEEVPDLRIIDDELWEAVKGRQAAIRREMNPAGVKGARPRPERARRPTYLFSGLLKCGDCGSGYTLINKTRYGCSGARNKGEAICTNRATIRRDEVEARVLGGLRDHLLQPELLEVFIEEYRLAFNEAAASANVARTHASRDLAEVERKLKGILTAIEDGMYQPSMKARMTELEGEKQRLMALIEDSPEPPVMRLHPSLTDLYRQQIADLAAALQDPELKAEATTALRSLISEIRLIPDKDAPGGHHLELIGELAGILSLAASADAQTTKPPRGAGAGGSRSGSETVVAGTRNYRYQHSLEVAI